MSKATLQSVRLAALVPVLAIFLQPECLSRDIKKTTGSEKQKEGWQQERHNGLGREILYASDHGVKFYYPEVGLCVLSRPPSWDVVWFNLKTKQQYRETLVHYRERKHMPPATAPPPSLIESTTTYAGLKSRKLTVPAGEQLLYYYVSEPVTLPNGALTFLGTFFGMPNFGGIPLGCNAAAKAQPLRETKTWYTLSSQLKVLPESTFFDPPPGFAEVTSADKVNSSASFNAAKTADRVKDNAAAEDVAKQMGVGVPFKK